MGVVFFFDIEFGFAGVGMSNVFLWGKGFLFELRDDLIF